MALELLIYLLQYSVVSLRSRTLSYEFCLFVCLFCNSRSKQRSDIECEITIEWMSERLVQWDLSVALER